MGTIQIDGSTPKLTIGNPTAEDASIVYDGNAKDFYIALDDSADKLSISLFYKAGLKESKVIYEFKEVKQ